MGKFYLIVNYAIIGLAICELRILIIVGEPVGFGVNLVLEGLLGCPNTSANLIGVLQAHLAV